MTNSGKKKCITKKSENAPMTPVRLKQVTYQKLTSILDKINQKDQGKKVRADDVVTLSLTLLKNEHLKRLQDNSLTNTDRMEILFQEFKSKNKNATKDLFLGALLKGDLSSDSSTKVLAFSNPPLAEVEGLRN